MTKVSSEWSLVIVIFLLSTLVVKAGQIEQVTNNSNDGPGSLRQAITNVSPGGQVVFDAQVLGDTIILTSGPLSISKNISINGDKDHRITLTSLGTSQLINISDQTLVTLNGLILDQGYVPPESSDIRSQGGAIYSLGRMELEYCVIKNCQAAFGGGVWADSLKMSHCTIYNNSSYKDGGGIYANVLLVRYSTISKNQTIGRIEKIRSGYISAKGSGGGIYVKDFLDIAQSTISNNRAGANGGGVYMSDQNAMLSMYNCTISDNTADEGGGIDVEASIGLFANNIIAGNIDSMIIAEDINSSLNWSDVGLVQHNLIGIYEGTDPFPGINNIVGTRAEAIDPLLETLDVGEYDATYDMQECSPAIDKGANLANTDTDQRGLPRTVGTSTDIGAIEYQTPDNRMCITMTCDSLDVSLGINKSVLYSNRGTFFQSYSCIDLAAKVSMGIAPYAYTWSPNIDISNTNDSIVTVCPTQDVMYTLTVVDANGCMASDEIMISSYSIREAQTLESCGFGRNRVLVCDPNTNTSVCSNIFSNSNTIGLGPLLNAGYIPGPCQNIVSNDEDIKSLIRHIDKVWPIPSRGEINFEIRKAENIELTFRIYNGNNDIIKEEIVAPSSQRHTHQTVQAKGLATGHYAYFTIVNNDVIDKGSFFVKN